MAFLYKSANINKFWMRNTPKSLDVVFCLNNKISEICYGEPHSLKLIGSDQLSDLIVEFPYGTCKKYAFKQGNSISLFLNKEAQSKIISF